MRMSIGPSRRKLIPRSASSSCGELTPRSATRPSTRAMPSASSSLADAREGRAHEHHPIGDRARARSSAAAMAVGIAVEADDARLRLRLEDAPRCARRRRASRRRRCRRRAGASARTTSSRITVVCSKRFTSLTSSKSSRQTHSTDESAASTPGRASCSVAHSPSSARRAAMSRFSSSVVSKWRCHASLSQSSA